MQKKPAAFFFFFLAIFSKLFCCHALCGYLSGADVACARGAPIALEAFLRKKQFEQRLAIRDLSIQVIPGMNESLSYNFNTSDLEKQLNIALPSELQKKCRDLNHYHGITEGEYQKAFARLSLEPDDPYEYSLPKSPFISNMTSIKRVVLERNKIIKNFFANYEAIERSESYPDADLLTLYNRTTSKMLADQSIVSIKSEIISIPTQYVLNEYRVFHRGFFSADKATFSRIAYNISYVEYEANRDILVLGDCMEHAKLFMNGDFLKICSFVSEVRDTNVCLPFVKHQYQRSNCWLETEVVTTPFLKATQLQHGFWTVATTSQSLKIFSKNFSENFSIPDSGLFDLSLTDGYQAVFEDGTSFNGNAKIWLPKSEKYIFETPSNFSTKTVREQLSQLLPSQRPFRLHITIQYNETNIIDAKIHDRDILWLSVTEMYDVHHISIWSCVAVFGLLVILTFTLISFRRRLQKNRISNEGHIVTKNRFSRLLPGNRVIFDIVPEYEAFL